MWFVTIGNFRENEWCVSEPYHIRKTRIRVMNLKGEIAATRLKREWKNLVLLQLHSCTDIEKLNLEKLESLCHLELINLTRLKALILAPESDLLRFVWLSGLDSLQHLPDFNTCCPNLQVMIITRCLTMNVPFGRITECKKLKSLHVDTGLYQALGPEVPGTSLGSNLMKLEISILKQASEEYVLNLEGLGRCDNLEWLILKDLPVKWISGLEEVKSLQRFGGRAIFYNCGNLEQAPEGASEIHNVYKITSPDGYLWTTHQWKEGTTRAGVTSHYVDRWGRDEDFCDYGDVPRYWIHQPQWNMNSNI